MRGRSGVLAPVGILAALALAAAALAGCGGGGAESTASQAGAPESGATQPSGGRAQAGGEKSIEGFGAEAEGSQRDAIISSFSAYLRAVAAREYAMACSHLTSTAMRGVERFAPPGARSRGCSHVLSELFAPGAAAAAEAQANGDIAKVRVEGRRAFVVFHAPGAKLYQLPMKDEGGQWKAGLVTAAILVPSAAMLGQR